jgi:uncharacterized protein (DUF983 family)
MSYISLSKPSFKSAIFRGLKRKCPCCGQGQAFRGYLKVVDSCEVCETPLGLYPCDDGPAYVTMLLVGHLVIGPMFALEFFWKYPLSFVVPVTMTALLILTLWVLPYIKGAFLALVWYHGLKDRR